MFTDSGSFVEYVRENAEGWKEAEYLTEEQYEPLMAGVREHALLTRESVTDSGRKGIYFVTSEDVPEFIWLRRSVSHFGKINVVNVREGGTVLENFFAMEIEKQVEAGNIVADYVPAPSLDPTSVVDPESFKEYMRNAAWPNSDSPYLSETEYEVFAPKVREFADTYRDGTLGDGRELILFISEATNDTVWGLRRSISRYAKLTSFGENADLDDFVAKGVESGYFKGPTIE